MKKILASVFALAVLAGCSSYYDYYKGGVRYTQDGEDCIYYVGENGRHFSNEIRNLDGNKKIVYRNTRCADLYARDSFNNGPRADRQILAPVVVQHDMTPVAKSCGCGKCGASSKYVLVSAM